TLTATSGPKTWRLRGAKPAPANRGVTYQIVQRRKGAAQPDPAAPPVEVDVPELLIHDSFEDALQLEFIPVFDPATVRRVYIDVKYEDGAYKRSERLEMPGSQSDPLKLRIALKNGDKRKFRRRFTFVGMQGQFDQRAWVEDS
ncbi:hypothetical protein RNT16_13375, partial [Staphylococcus pseudintermedius]|nr:hypothetical protein [Staphylococcus pseudintermedius]